MISSPFEFWTILESVWCFYGLGLVLKVNLEFLQTLWVWRTGCRYRSDVSACYNAAGVPHLVTVTVLVLPSLSGNAENAASRDKKDVFWMIQHVYSESAGLFLSISTESSPTLTS